LLVALGAVVLAAYILWAKPSCCRCPAWQLVCWLYIIAALRCRLLCYINSCNSVRLSCWIKGLLLLVVVAQWIIHTKKRKLNRFIGVFTMYHIKKTGSCLKGLYFVLDMSQIRVLSSTLWMFQGLCTLRCSRINRAKSWAFRLQPSLNWLQL